MMVCVALLLALVLIVEAARTCKTAPPQHKHLPRESVTNHRHVKALRNPAARASSSEQNHRFGFLSVR